MAFKTTKDIIDRKKCHNYNLDVPGSNPISVENSKNIKDLTNVMIFYMMTH